MKNIFFNLTIDKILPTGGNHGLVNYLSNPHHQLKNSFYWSIELNYHQSDEIDSLLLRHTSVIDVRSVNELRLVSGQESAGPISISGSNLFGVKAMVNNKN